MEMIPKESLIELKAKFLMVIIKNNFIIRLRLLNKFYVKKNLFHLNLINNREPMFKKEERKTMVTVGLLSNQDESNIFVLPPNHTKPLPHVNECLGNWMKDSCSNVIEECGWLEPIIEIGFEPGLPFYCGSVDDHEDDGGADNDANEGADNDAHEGPDNDANEGPDNDANEGADEDENEDPVIHEHLSTKINHYRTTKTIEENSVEVLMTVLMTMLMKCDIKFL